MVICAGQLEHTLAVRSTAVPANFYLYTIANAVSNKDDGRQMAPLAVGLSVLSRHPNLFKNVTSCRF